MVKNNDAVKDIMNKTVQDAAALQLLSKKAITHKPLAKALAAALLSSEKETNVSDFQVSEKLDDVNLLHSWQNDVSKKQNSWRDYDFGPMILTVGELNAMIKYVEDIKKNSSAKNGIDQRRTKMLFHWDTLRFVKLLELLKIKKIENLFEKVDKAYDSNKTYEYLGGGKEYQYGIEKIKEDLQHRFDDLIFMYTKDYDLKDPRIESVIKEINFIVSGNYFKDAVYESPENWHERSQKPGFFCNEYTKKIESVYPHIYEEFSQKLWMPLENISEYISNMYQKEYINVQDWDRINLEKKALKHLDEEILYLWKYLIQDLRPNYLQSLRSLKDLVTWAWILDLKPIMADDEVEFYSTSDANKIPPTN